MTEADRKTRQIEKENSGTVNPTKSEMLYKLMLRKGYPEGFAKVVSAEMRTDYTAERMLTYIGRTGRKPLEEVADEMLAIISDRDRIRDKHINEHAQNKINILYREINE